MSRITVTTSWDDGHRLDKRLASLLKKYNIPGTFYVAPRNHQQKSQDLLTDSDIQILAKDFEIGGHTMTHPKLTRINDSQALQEIIDCKSYLENVIKKKVTSFCYPNGAYRRKHVSMVKEAGFEYARTVKRHLFSKSRDALQSGTTIHTYSHWLDLWKIAKFARFNPVKFVPYLHWDKLAIAMFDRVLEHGGDYHLWGHSWEIESRDDWERLEKVLEYIGNRPEVEYVTNAQLSSNNQRNLLVTAPYFPPHGGGQEYYAANISSRLDKDYEWNVSVVTSGEQKFGIKSYVRDNIQIYELPTWIRVANTPINPLWPIMIRRIIRKIQPEIINAHAPVVGFAEATIMAAGRIPVVLTYHFASMQKGEVGIDTIIKLYEKFVLPWTLKRSRQVIAASDFVKRYLRNITKTPIDVINPGVDVDRFYPSTNSVQNQLLFVGNLFSHKGLKYLLHAMPGIIKNNPDVRLRVVGTGPELEDNLALVKNLGIGKHVSFEGAVPNEEMGEFYRTSNILILPSTLESFGMVLIEAMSSGLAVVGANNQGINDVIDDGINGILVEPESVSDLETSINKLLASSKIRNSLGVNGRAKAISRYAWNIQAKKHDKLLNDVLAIVEDGVSSQPKVTHVVAYYPPHLGGMERVAQSLAEGMAERNYSVRVLTSGTKPDTTFSNNNLTVKFLKVSEIAHVPIIYSLLWQLLRTPKRSVIHLHLSQAFIPEMVLIAAFLRRIPYIVHFHLDVGPSGYFRRIFFLYKRIFTPLILKHARYVVTLSDQQREFVINTYGISSEKVTVIPNGVSEHFLARKPKKFHGPLQLLYVGRFNAQKQVIRIVEAMKSLPDDYTLHLVGDGEDRQMIESAIEKNKLTNVIMHGQLFGDELLQMYRNSDVFVLPSDIEGFPLVLLEAMASGLAIVGSDVQGIKEHISGTGILVTNPSAKSFADALMSLNNNHAELRRLSRASISNAKNYTWESIYNEFMILYKKALEQEV